MNEVEKEGLTPEEIERLERVERRRNVEAQLEDFRAEVKADDEKREKRREERRRFRARLYYILLALLIIGIVAFLVIKRDLIWN